MKIAILTMFKTLKETYSIVGVVKSHIQMLLQSGATIKMIVSEECALEEKYGVFLESQIEWFEVPNHYKGQEIVWKNYYDQKFTLGEEGEAAIKMLEDVFLKALSDVEVCMLHDILYQEKHYIHNCAIRNIQVKIPHVHYIAFTHSYPLNRPGIVLSHEEIRYMPLPNTLYVYPTQAGISALAKQYKVSEGDCYVIHHPVNLLEGMSEEVIMLHQQVNLLDSDILIIAPARLTQGKQLEKVAQLGGAISTVGNVAVKIIFCDFASSDIEVNQYQAQIREVGEQYGLRKADMIFTSECGYLNGFPHKSVLQLFMLSNLYICPSKSESFSLTVLEAARWGNFIILNENVSSLKEMGKWLNSYFMKWDARCTGYDIQQSYGPSEAAYYGKHAKKILEKLKNDKTNSAKTQVRKRFNAEWIWKNQMLPLIQLLTKKS